MVMVERSEMYELQNILAYTKILFPPFLLAFQIVFLITILTGALLRKLSFKQKLQFSLNEFMNF